MHPPLVSIPFNREGISKVISESLSWRAPIGQLPFDSVQPGGHIQSIEIGGHQTGEELFVFRFRSTGKG